ncbi:penicillin-binding protein activator [Solimonas marina]|uniref:Penicillin-binding protein activator n=1 Tax=Solimonas marina TaxID=2714601 RepID=A0A969W9G3_9GAMM|nr:penicillin-binding protein activator [Solimonas marina]
MPKTLLPKTLIAALPALLVAACSQLPQRQAPPPPASTAQTPPPNTAPAPQPVAKPAQLALLLPLSGAFSATADSVRDGFFSAYFNDSLHPPVRVYDVGSTPSSLRAAYQTALREGATFIIGPLRKSDVAALAGDVPAVPVLALNYLDDGAQTPPDFYQFGLSPEDEARSAAREALAQGLHRAVALVPSADWGDRVVDAFNQTLRAGGGAVVAEQHYDQGTYDQSKIIAALMGVDASQARHRALTAALGESSEYEPQRRQDIDMIFIAARGQDARMLMPQLKFNRAGDLPVYATALVYDGKPSADTAGVRFCDAPWTIGDSPALQQARAASDGLPISNPRLFALGRDAYGLSAGLAQHRIREGDTLDGVTGKLEWQGTVIHRDLSCVQIGDSGLSPLNP